jgi:SAM-dependent methyltransferase
MKNKLFNIADFPTQEEIYLQKTLQKIDKIISIEKILSEKWNEKIIHSYYKKMDFLYQYFHSKEGAMHFPIYTPEKIKHHAEGLREQAEFVKEKALKINAKKIAELGCGIGYNVAYLAKNIPHIKSYGVDLSAKHIQFAKKKNNLITNAYFEVGNLENPVLKEFDILFGVESFCYTRNLEITLKNWYSSLNKGGNAIIFDVFLPNTYQTVSPAFQTSVQLTALGFAVEKWWQIEQLKTIAQNIGWKIIEITDISKLIQPNLQRFGKDSEKILRYPLLTKMATNLKIFPKTILKHCITGILAAQTIGTPAQAYYRIVLEK